jgi:PAS domain S-box-containing protein
VLTSLVVALGLSLLLRPYLYPRPLLLLALVLTLWGRGLGPGLVGAAFATVAARIVFPELAPAYGVVSDAVMFGLAAVAFAVFSRAQMRAESQRKLMEKELRTNQRRFIEAQRLAKVGSWERHFEADPIHWSDEVFRIFGLPIGAPPDFSTLLSYIHPDDRRTILEAEQEARSSGGPAIVHYRIIRPDGEVRFVRSIVEVIEDGTGLPLRIKGATQDVTEEAHAKAALRESEQRFRAIFYQAGVGIAQIGLKGEWLILNDRFCEMLGYTQAELLSKTFLDVTHPDDHEMCLRVFQRYMEDGLSSWSGEKRYVHKNGSPVWVNSFVSDVRDRNNQLEYFVVVVEDITERKQADAALQDSERRLRLAQSVAPLGIWELDLPTNASVTSPECFALYGLRPDHPQLSWQEGLKLVHPDDREWLERAMRQSVAETHFWDTEHRVVWPDGSVHWLLAKGRVFLDDSGRPVRLAGVNLDITERKQAQAALYESEERFRNMADAAPVMIWASGPGKTGTFFSKRWLDFTGRTMEQESANRWESVHPEDLERCLATYSSSFDARRDFQTEYRLRRADGEYRWVVDYGVPRFAPGGIFAGYIGSAIDVHDLKRAQEEALARHKLECLGVLSAGIAHDFNNLLGSILAQAELAESDVPSGTPAAEEIRQIKSVAIRASEIVRELMIYSGQDKEDFDLVDVTQLVDEMIGLLKISVSKTAALQTDFQQPLPLVRGNAPQIRQVVMNLIINASEAIGIRHGVIRIVTSRATADGNLAADPAVTLPEGDYVKLEISDTGCGMTEDARARIFDPFYTTKFAGRGLGLAVVQGIVRAHGGVIDLATAPGQGTTFRVFFPCASEATLRAPDIALAVRDERIPNTAGTVLLVEDEDALRTSVSKLLRKRGFSIIEAEEGRMAVDLFRSHTDNIDVMLLDVTIPGISSREVIAEARRIRPDIKIILMSAYSREMALPGLEEIQVSGFIRKPFQLGDLMPLLQDTLCS